MIPSRTAHLQYPSGVQGLRYAPSTVAGTMARSAALASVKSGRRQGVEPDPNEPEGLGSLATEHTAPNFRGDAEAAAEQPAEPKPAYDGRLGYDFGRRTRLNLYASPLSCCHSLRVVAASDTSTKKPPQCSEPFCCDARETEALLPNRRSIK